MCLTLFPRAAGKIPVLVAQAGSGRRCESPGWMLAQCLQSWRGWEVLGRAHLGKAESRVCRESQPPHPSSLHPDGMRGSSGDSFIVREMTVLSGEMSPGRGGCIFLTGFP